MSWTPTPLALLATGLLLPATLACGDKSDQTGTDDSGQSAAEADADTDSDADGDTDSDTDTDNTGDMTPGDPVFTATFSTETWTTGGGYWSGSTTSTIQGDDPDSELELQIALDGNLRSEDTLEVTEIIWVDTVHNGYDFYYKAEPDGAIQLLVEGRDAEGDYIWGSLSGGIEMTDIESGKTLTLEGITVESWPRFGI